MPLLTVSATAPPSITAARTPQLWQATALPSFQTVVGPSVTVTELGPPPTWDGITTVPVTSEGLRRRECDAVPLTREPTDHARVMV